MLCCSVPPQIIAVLRGANSKDIQAWMKAAKGPGGMALHGIGERCLAGWLDEWMSG
jgi:hypothetical protein